MRALVALAVTVLAVPVLLTPAAAATAASVVYRFGDPRIVEASGIAVGVRSPGIDYVQNDSGDTNRFFGVAAANGSTAAVVTVPGATNVDWEDIAVAPDAAGRSSVWLADTGDNDAVRDEVQVYRVDEPSISADDHDRALSSSRPDVWRLRYPGGPVDAESLAVGPTGTGYLITKSLLGDSVVYRLPERPDRARVQTLVAVGTIRFTAHDSSTPIGRLGTLTATSASLNPDGSLLAVRTYADAFVWRVDEGDVAGALRRTPTRVPLPVQPQGEGIAFRGRDLLIDSEGVGSAVYAVPLPAALTRPTTTPATAPSTGSRPSSPVDVPATQPGSEVETTNAGSGGQLTTTWLLTGAVTAALAGVALAWVTRRRRAR